MRQAIAAMFTVLLFAPAVFARGNHDWEHVEKLKPGTTVLISLWSGRTISGRVEAVDTTTLRIDTADSDIGFGR